MSIVVGILYVLTGFLVAIPYCLLAGWNTEAVPMVAFVAPAFLFVWFILAMFAGVLGSGYGERLIYFSWRAAFRKSEQRGLPGSRVVFWVWTLYSLMPIILHWSAILLNSIGYASVGTMLDIHRYASPFYIFIATMVSLVLIGMTQSAWETMKNEWMRLTHR